MAIVDQYSQETVDKAVLDSLIASATQEGLPIEWETLTQGIATNAAWVGRAYYNLLDATAAAAQTNPDLVNAIAGNNNKATAEIEAFSDKFFDSLTSQYNKANGTNYVVDNNIKFVPPNNPNAGHDNAVIQPTWSVPTTTNITVPAVYETVTTTVPVSTSVTKYRTVRDVTYTENRSSNITSSMIPYMRSIYLAYKGNGYKPNSSYFAYFDGISVSSYITPATEIVIQVASPTVVFDSSTDVGAGVSLTSRVILDNPVNTLTTGDVITDSTSSATAVLLGYEYASTTSIRLFVVNVKGTFTVGHVVTGSISGSSGTITSISTGVSGTITSSPYGNLYGLYKIPNNTTEKFTTGAKKLLFSTGSATDTQADSWGSTIFTASGTLTTVQPVLTTIRHVSNRQEAYTTTETTYNTVTSNVLVQDSYVQTISGLTEIASLNQMPHVEPLAQSFYVHEETGVFLTGIDLFFASKDSSLPVYVSIIDLVNGFPGPNEIDLSKTTIPAYDVKLSSNQVIDANGGTWAAADTPTRITFKSPVFLEGLKDYCIFIKSDSFKYRVWTSYMKDSTINGTGMVSSQPSMGTFFKSQNATTWTEDQNQDLTYKLYRAKFNTSVTPTIEFRNAPLKSKSVPYGAIQTYSGFNKVRIYLLNHGLTSGSLVSLSGITATNDINALSIVAGKTYVIKTVGTGVNWTAIGASAATVGIKFVANSTTPVGTGGVASEAPYYGLTSAELTGQFTVIDADLDTFTINVATAPIFNGTIIDPTLSISKNVAFNSLQTIIQELKPTGTNIRYEYQARVKNTPSVYSTLSALPNNKIIDASDTLLVMSPDNESTNGPSFKMNATLTTNSDWVSPMIDTHRLSVVTTGNRIDNPSTAYNVTNIDYDSIVTSSNLFTISSTNNSFNTSNAATKLLVSKFIIGSYVSVTGCSNAANNGSFMITYVASDGSYFTVASTLVTESPTGLTMLWGRRYKDETTPFNSSTLAKYVSKQLQFANPSTSFKLFFIYNKPSAANIKFYYKISNSSDNSIHENLPYVYAPFTTDLISSEAKDNLSEGSIHLQNLTPFDTLSIKIVYTSSDTNKIPRIRDFRIVALA